MRRKDTFKEQFPGYEIIPLKESRWKWPLAWVLTISGLLGLPAYYMYIFSRSPIPISNMVGFNNQSIPTLGHFAITLSEAGRHQEAVRHFAGYFQLGGTSPEAMAFYAASLDALGQEAQALKWAAREYLEQKSRE